MKIPARISLISLSTLLFVVFIFSLGATPGFAYKDAFDLPTHKLRLTLDLDNGTINGKDEICCFSSELRELRLLIGDKLTIDSVVSDGEELPFLVEAPGDGYARSLTVTLPPPPLGAASADLPRYLRIDFKGSFSGLARARRDITRGVSYENEGVIDSKGAFLPSFALYYPIINGTPALFDVEIITPIGVDAVMEGAWVSSTDRGGMRINRWKTSHPLDGINIVAARYVVAEERYKGINILTFLFDKDDLLSRRYIDKVKDYIDLYEGLLPPYPYSKFAVVESFLPTGFGMPSFTLLGSNVIRLPFIPDTSLGHEFVHNWWGNSVFVDPSYGNWSEALATYTADHRYAAAKGAKKARENRQDALAEFRSYAGSSGGPLSSFRYATDTVSRAVGYNKGAMVFHMLSSLIGEDVFYAGLSEFHRANAFSYATTIDLKVAMEKISHRELDWFFEQWFLRSGGPELTLSDLEFDRKNNWEGPFKLSFTLSQSEPSYLMELPILIETKGRSIIHEILLRGPKKSVEITLSELPIAITVDPDYDLFRLVSAEEAPPTFAAFFGSKGVMALPSDAKVALKYESVATALARDYSLEVITDIELESGDYAARPLFVLGGRGENALYRRVARELPEGVRISSSGKSLTIYGKRFDLTDAVAVIAVRDSENPGNTICLLLGGLDAKKIARIGRRLTHLTNKGYLIFDFDGGLTSGSFKWESLLRSEVVVR